MQIRTRVLLIDDDQDLIDVISMFLKEMDITVTVAKSGEAGLEILKKDSGFDLILLDQKLPGVSGQEVYGEVKGLYKDILVIMITAYATVAEAVSAIKEGVHDYLTKPIEKGELELSINRARKIIELNKEVNLLRKAIEDVVNKHDGIITRNRRMLGLLEKVDAIAAIDSTVMISGESGTGKELFARAIHKASPRSAGPFIAINCASFTEELLGSSLFGFEKGAFTGAMKKTLGCLEEAAGGTLFLDEVAEMSPKLQSSLLRALQEREFCRIGSYKPIKTKFRLITASNKIMPKEVMEERFREDLYYRLNVIPIHLPPLRDRADDIPLLALHFMKKHNGRMGKKIEPCSNEAITTLKHHKWPGNCRELENVIEHILAIKKNGAIELKDLPDYLLRTTVNKNIDRAENGVIETFEEMKNESEKKYFFKTYKLCKGNITHLSKLTKLSRTALYEKLKKYRLK